MYNRATRSLSRWHGVEPSLGGQKGSKAKTEVEAGLWTDPQVPMTARGLALPPAGATGTDALAWQKPD